MVKPYYEANGVTIYLGDCREVMPQLSPVSAIVTDPPYGLEFMGKEWDAPWKTDRRQNFNGTLNDQRENPYGRSKVRNGNGASYGAGAATMRALQDWYYSWAVEALRVLKPGGHILSFGGSRTYHRMASAIEDAGFEIRDQIMWLYGSGFPKSMDVSKAIDKAAGAERTERLAPKPGHEDFVGKDNLAGLRDGSTVGTADGGYARPWMNDPQKVEDSHWDFAPVTESAKQWDGWGTALKPAHEPICVARKPLTGTVAANVQEHGTGALNIDGCRIDAPEGVPLFSSRGESLTHSMSGGLNGSNRTGEVGQGRWPANVIHDGSEEVVSRFPETSSGEMKAGTLRAAQDEPGSVCYGTYGGNATTVDTFADSGSAARFFYTAKADKAERGTGNTHPTVKPLDLMRYLCKLVSPPSGGILLDPFAGSGSTLIAARGFFDQVIGIELEEKYAEIAAKRLAQEVFVFQGEDHAIART